MLLSANCVVLAIDAPLPYGDKTELTKQLVTINISIIPAIHNNTHFITGINRSVLPRNIYS